MTRKVFMLPTPSQARVDTTNSINQIVLRLGEYLPKYGYELTENLELADLVAAHAGQAGSKLQVDVCHCHGLYPTAYPNLTLPWHQGANQDVVANLIRARHVTVPSKWVADILRRDMHIQPSILPWAIEPEKWDPGTDGGYVLWNKTRTDGVCDPKPVGELARRAPGVQFVSTFATNPVPSNIRVIGRQPYDMMKRYIESSSVYLATTKETFGIGILEAMAAGVPILGFRHGNIMSLVEHGVNGYLVEPDDYDGLVQGLDYCRNFRQVLGKNGIKVAAQFTWDNVAKSFAAVYDDVLAKPVGAKVSIVIPHHNYGQYVGGAIQSATMQKAEFEIEVIVVDDGSNQENLLKVREEVENARKNLDITVALDHELDKSQPLTTIQLIESENGGVAHARNLGISKATGEYIVCLDADDELGNPSFAQELATIMDKDRGLGIAYTQLQMMNAEGTLGEVSRWPNNYNWDLQTLRRNQVPTCCMFRREAWKRAGGYKAKYSPAEDAELWLRIGALGYTAQLAVEAPWFKYRLHNNSLSSPVREGKAQEPDWVSDKPWVESKLYPFAADGKARPVRNYDKPKVSIVIPVSEYHVNILPEVLDSVEAQTDPYWECIVVNDSGTKLTNLAPYPWARVVSTGGKRGAGFARNTGVKHAKAPLVAFVDADDLLLPKFLERTTMAFQRTGRYIYTDWYSVTKDGRGELHETPDFETGATFKKPMQHSINILLRREWVELVGGFDETMPSWEDVEFFMKLAAKGICGFRVAEPLIVYRYQTGKLRERGEDIKQELINLLTDRYRDFIEGRNVCNCGGAIKTSQAKVNETPATNPDGTANLVRILYNGPAGNHDVIGPASLKNYGRRAGGQTFYVWVEDQKQNPALFEALVDTIFTPEAMPTPIPPPPSLIPDEAFA